MPLDPVTYSARLYAALHELDGADVELIIVDSPPNEPPWLAIHDRLRRASN
jgi:L-threonylcarbamoyladenylate synthase